MLFAGLFCATFATLLLEILDGRLLSVLTWYHLSFLAVSLAMLGMAAGAIRVFLARSVVLRRKRRPPAASCGARLRAHDGALTRRGAHHPALGAARLLDHRPRIAHDNDRHPDDPVLLLRDDRHDRSDANRRADRPPVRLGSCRRRVRLPRCRAGARLRLVQPELARPAGRSRRCRERLLLRPIAAVAATVLYRCCWRCSWLRPVRSMVRGSADWRSRTRRTVSTGCRSTRTGRIGTATRTSSCSVPDGGNRSCGAAAVCRITQSV